MKTLHYLVSECNYGGRITDERDRVVINALIEDFFSFKVFNADFKFGGSEGFSLPDCSAHNSFLKYIVSLPKHPSIEVLGFH